MALNAFQEMQMMAMLDSSSVLDTRKALRKIVDFWREQPWQQEQIGYFAKMRKLKVETLNSLEGFMVKDDFPVEYFPEELAHDSYGFCKNKWFIYSGRFVFPVKDVKGNIMGFVGYDAFEAPKYLDSKNHGYKAKDTTFFGMERMPEYYDAKYLFIVEGPICMAWLRESGFNAVSSLGSYLNEYAARIFKRLGGRAIFIPDGDEAGAKYARNVRLKLPQARVLRPVCDKDVDDTRLGKSDKDITDEQRIKRSNEVVAELKLAITNPFGNRKYFL